MTINDRLLREIARYSPLDVMLADVAVAVQLSPTDYQTAIGHYHAINDWIDRAESPLHGLVEAFYPQGGFSIGATVARHSTDDEFDIDAMAQLALRTDADPEAVLALMDRAIRAEKGSRYYDKADRKTRCSTVYYAGMHLDVTPTIRLAGLSEKTGFIFHSKPSDLSVPKQRIYANPFGFANWFILNTPADEAFGAFFEKRSLDYDRTRLLAKADATPVPDQMPVYRKSLAVIALQLLKRWRNLAYDRRHPRLRRPPSVLIAYYVARHANQTRSLADELIHQAESIAAILEAADAAAQLVHAVNPACATDVLTDRWPGNTAEQSLFARELRSFSSQISRLKQAPLAEIQRILTDLFGERPAGDSIRKSMEQHGRDNAAGTSFHIPGRGAVPALGSLAVPTVARATPRSTPFGD